MENKKVKKVSVSNNSLFEQYCQTMAFILIVSLMFSIVDKRCNIIKWPEGYEDIIGVSTQIITALVSLVVSIIGIAISLQNEDFFGVKIRKLYALRRKDHYSILSIILISIFICTLNLSFYMFGLTIATIGTLLVGLLFLIQVIWTEVPIMEKREEAVVQIIKDNIIYCHLNDTEAPKDLKDAVKYLLYSKNLKETYGLLKDKNDQEYNKYLFMKLLEYQQHLTFELKEKYNKNEQIVIGSSLLENVSDVILRHVEITDEMYYEIANNKYLLTRVMFRLLELPSVKTHVLNKINGLYQTLFFIPLEKKQINVFISDLIIVLVAGTIKKDDFSVIKAIRYQLSHSSYFLSKESYEFDVFAVISMQLYYLVNSEPDVPQELKQKIGNFINEDNIIEDQTKIKSWKKLFYEALENFKIDYDRFVSLAKRNSDTLEYYLYGDGAKFVVFDVRYFSQWYLTHLFNSRHSYSFDFDAFISKYQDVKPYFKEFGNKSIDDNQNFVPTKEMVQIIEFYNEEREHFVWFKIAEERDHRFFKLINNMKYEDLKNDVELSMQINDEEFADVIRTSIEDAVESEWGYDVNLSIDNTDREFSVLIEKFPEAINFKDVITDFCVRSVFNDIRNSIKKRVIYNDELFENNICEMISGKLVYITENLKNIIPHLHIKDTQLKNDFKNISEKCNVFTTKLLGGMVVVTQNGFKFNCKVEKVEIRKLDENELDKKVAKYQRADGQFVFDGVFLPREEIVQIISEKFVILSVVIKHQVQYGENSIFDIRPYSKEPEE